MNRGRNLGQKYVKSSSKSSFCNYHLGARHLSTAVSPWATRLLIGIIRKSSAITADKIVITGKLHDHCILWLLALSGSRLSFWEKHVFVGSPRYYRSSIIAFVFLPGFYQRKSVSVQPASDSSKANFSNSKSFFAPKSQERGVTTHNLMFISLLWTSTIRALMHFHFLSKTTFLLKNDFCSPIGAILIGIPHQRHKNPKLSGQQLFTRKNFPDEARKYTSHDI